MALEAELHLAGDVKKTKWKLTWLSQSAQVVDLTLVDFDHLITKKKLDEEDNFLDFLNPHTRWVQRGGDGGAMSGGRRQGLVCGGGRKVELVFAGWSAVRFWSVWPSFHPRGTARLAWPVF